LLAPPGWRDRLDDLTGGLASRYPPGALLVAAVAVVAVAVLVLRPPGGGAAPELPMAPDHLATSRDPGAGGPPGAEGVPVPTTAGTATGATAATAVGDELTAHVAGAVTSPGVRSLPAGSRLADLVAAAGGTTADADLDRVNLAAPVVDGSRVWIPRVGADAPALVDVDVPGPSAGGAPGAAGDGPAATTSLSSASPAQLEELPGVGPATAAAIVAHREANGPFRTVDDLLEVRGIGPAKLEQIRPLAVP
jgi:competence protein ComEA